MKWVPVQIDIPEEILTIYEKITDIQPNSCIAGGYLSDLFMGHKYKDVDIFIKGKKEKKQEIETLLQKLGGTKTKESHVSSVYVYKTGFDVQTYHWGNYEIQLIFTPFGITAPKFFDYRFREFFYFKGCSYASAEAIHDIENKKLVFGVTKAPLVALLRAATFKTRYGFAIEDRSFRRFKQLFNAYNIPQTVWNTYKTSMELTKEIKIELEKISPTILSTRFVGYPEEMEEVNYLHHLKKRNFKRDHIEELERVKEHIETYQFSLEGDPFKRELEDKKKKIIRVFQRIRLQLVIHKPYIAEKWSRYVDKLEEYIDKWKSEITHLIYIQFSELSYLFPLLVACSSYIETMQLQSKLKPTMHLQLDYKSIWISSYHFNLYQAIRGKYVKISVENFKELVWDIRKKNIVYSNMDSTIEKLIMKKLREQKVIE